MYNYLLMYSYLIVIILKEFIFFLRVGTTIENHN